jgi:hypothetical protein
MQFQEAYFGRRHLSMTVLAAKTAELVEDHQPFAELVKGSRAEGMKEGWLMRRGAGVLKKWTRVWVRVHGSSLSVWNSEGEAKQGKEPRLALEVRYSSPTNPGAKDCISLPLRPPSR